MEEVETEEDKRIKEARKSLPPVDAMLLLQDFEDWGQRILSGTAWAYYRSAGELRMRHSLEITGSYVRYFTADSENSEDISVACMHACSN